jgi:predicted ATPase
MLQLVKRLSGQRLMKRMNSSISASAAKDFLLSDYKADVTAGKLQYDEKQYHVLRYLSRLCDHLGFDYTKTPLPISEQGKSALVLEKGGKPRSSPIKVVHYTGIGSNTVQPTEMTAINTSNSTTGGTSAAQVQPETRPPTPTAINAPQSSEAISANARIVKGVYVYGEVGTGKTLLMDNFFKSVNLPIEKKRRVHFHEFLLEIHSRIRKFRLDLIEKHGRSIQVDVNPPSERDAIEQVALQVADEAWLLCFDEFQVTDVADALILRRFFDVLWDQGTILVATSNRPPTDLYKNGINRSYFEPFVDRLMKHSVVCDINSNIDYRSRVSHSEDCYIVIPADEVDKRTPQLWQKFLAIGNDNISYKMQHACVDKDDLNADISLGTNKLPFSQVLNIMMGRSMVVDHAFPRLPISQLHTLNMAALDGATNTPRLSLHHSDRVIGNWPGEGTLTKKTMETDQDIIKNNDDNEDMIKLSGASRGVGWFDFNFLCDKERGASDYQAICREFDTVFLNGIPELSVLEHDKARRFIILIDTLYDNHTRLYWSGRAAPQQIFRVLTPDEVVGTALQLGSSATLGTDLQWKRNSNTHEDNDAHMKEPRKQQDPEERPMLIHPRGDEQLKMSFHLGGGKVLTGTSESTTDAADELQLLEGELASVQELSFAFRRAASRLTEMAGSEYHKKWLSKVNK